MSKNTSLQDKYDSISQCPPYILRKRIVSDETHEMLVIEDHAETLYIDKKRTISNKEAINLGKVIAGVGCFHREFF